MLVNHFLFSKLTLTKLLYVFKFFIYVALFLLKKDSEVYGLICFFSWLLWRIVILQAQKKFLFPTELRFLIC